MEDYEDQGHQPRYDLEHGWAFEPPGPDMPEHDRYSPRQNWQKPALIIAGVAVLLLIFILLLTAESNPPPQALRQTVPEIEKAGKALVKKIPKINGHALAISPEEALKSLVLVTSRGAEHTYFGSAVLVRDGRTVLTNYHVVENGEQISCSNPGGERTTARVIAQDKDLDLALLQLQQPIGQQTLELANSDAVRIGTAVMALGYPRSTALENTPTITQGIVSSIPQKFGLTWLQIDAAVNPGNSGGPLIIQGTNQVIGIVTIKLEQSEGIAFALPINTCKLFLERALK